ncbi:oxysterol-binding protein-related protein 6 isoform X1 [Patella vulgata]|uniref:oxysterol-binding protein-related protein 6 isoform X1 n=1 Tax=Patella vulgata TaxID=6465 RepID=UPI00217FCDA7|nr:oxysterol-binding protein-related protein 6 isoform X1 [Patella vulgata]XP_050388657.1 oxysterol-binding protein-related protein 6 isoform X1 [Patella vulgata]XP_050388658.1 oxysterol-binding protein-related protein 6 isoform X1 [Patella vulgata]
MSNGTHDHMKHADSNSDSDNSGDDGSISSSQVEGPQSQSSNAKPSPHKSRKSRKSRQEWIILEGLRDGQRCGEKPERHQGFLMKRRKWPLKGWHKRFFTLEKGILTYAKSPNDILKGKLHGVIDIGLAVISYKRKRQRLDIDAEEQVYHIKVKDSKVFDNWIDRIRHHRLYRQHEIAYGTKESPRLTEISSPIEDIVISPLATANLPEKSRTLTLKKEVIRQASFNKGVGGQSRVAAWVLDTAGFEKCNKDLSDAQNTLYELRDLLEDIQNLPLSGETTVEYPELLTQSCEKPKTRRFVGVRTSKRKSKKLDSPTHGRDSITSSPTLSVPDRIHTSTSNPNLISSVRPNSMPDTLISPAHEQRIQEIRLRENFISKAEQVHSNLKSLVHMMGTERERLKHTLEAEATVTAASTATLSPNTATNNNMAQNILLQQKLNESYQQNAELRARLVRIGAECNLTNLMQPMSPLPSPVMGRDRVQLAQSMSAESFSMSEYYDAEENVEGGSETSSEPSDEEDISSEVSEEGNDTAVTSASEDILTSVFPTGRRSKLPVPQPDSGDISLWNLLYKNIGKDLTKISMPVTLNEPLSSLQRLCEELEYSDLLDKASEYDDPYERMIYVAAFAVSSYASSYYRAGHKPFNPLLGETYECIREDKGWRFIAEQVSHHPPISACHADSRNFTMWQDMRVKTKFWGKSMEIQPLGTVNVTLPKYNDHYRWNKVTTCVHNLLGGQRWVDQYGEMKITNGNIVCKLTFTKASHWSSKRHEVCGSICTLEGKVVHTLFGQWNEGLFCGQGTSASCIWRPGAMPVDHELYYGFTRFAIELNELDHDQARFLPPTDSRFRPDQRMLEEGQVQEAEYEKSRIEQLQRERRKRDDKEIEPLWFRQSIGGDKDVYKYNSKYWETRKNPGFLKMSFIKLW